jgi:hypothetical protein
MSDEATCTALRKQVLEKMVKWTPDLHRISQGLLYASDRIMMAAVANFVLAEITIHNIKKSDERTTTE